MNPEKLNRINELAAKVKAGGTLTEAELAEREQLRAEYRASIIQSLKGELSVCKVVDENGNVLRDFSTQNGTPTDTNKIS